MSLNISVSMTSNTPALKALMAALSPSGRKALHGRAATRLHVLIKTHLIGVAASHHTSASRLGAQPTGHLAKAAERMTRSHDSDGGAINIYSPGFKRVFQAFTIFPRVAKALTIPIHPMAYGRRVSEVALMVKGVFRPKGTNILAYNDGDKLVPLYILVKKAFIPQDRSLLPSDSAMEQAVADGIRSGVRAAIERLGAA